jgi:uncharacterized delta-60 repeat protein
MALLSSVLAAPALALAPGEVDSTFGQGGMVVTPGTGVLFDLERAPDGKLVAIGQAFFSPEQIVARYDADGTLDSGFGMGGIVRDPVANFNVEGLAVQSTGKIVLAGRTGSGGQAHVALVRLQADGTLDTGFGSGGLVVTDFGVNSFGEAIVVAPDDRIVVAGSAGNNVALAGYAADGTPDASFGVGGRTLTPDVPYFVTNMVRQPDGGLVVVSGELVRYAANGMLDTGFGDAGVAGADGLAIHAVALHADGRITAAGSAPVAGGIAIAAARFGSDGQLDATFGTGGTVTTTYDVLFGSHGAAVAVDADDRALVAGTMGSAVTHDDFALVRYTPDGSLDPTFGPGGKLSADLSGFQFYENAVAIVQQPDAKVVVGGTVHGQFGLVRYETACASLPDADGDGIGDTCDPCTNGAAITRPRLSVKRLAGLPGNERIAFAGTLPVASSFDGTSSGLRVLIEDAYGAILGAMLPPGNYNATLGAGWRTANIYQNGNAELRGAVGGISGVKVRRTNAGLNFVVKTKNATYQTAAARLPLKGTLVLEPLLGVGETCGEAEFPGPPGPSCTSNPSGTTLQCR